jgi:hypothetical protein
LICKQSKLWADNKAISIILGGLLTKSRASLLLKVFPKPSDKIFIWSFAMYTLFRIWKLKTDPTNLAGDHPPNVLRFQLAMEGAALTVASILPELGERTFREAVAAGMQLAELAIVYCGGKRLITDEAVGTSDPRVAAHGKILLDHFDHVLRPELPAHAYVPLRDPSP